ncbi:response regulator, partial [Bacillus cereus]|nr:response regulator [Bacillus cereus]
LVTALGRDDVATQSAGRHFEAVLHKPVTPSALLDAVSQAYGRRADAHAPTPGDERLEASMAAVAGARVLLVEDSPVNAEVASHMLEAFGLRCTLARDGRQALQELEHARFDLVLMDCQMPGMDGFTLCRTLKATPAWAHVPVVFMTGLSDTDQIIRGFASGGVDYVVKPLRIPEVLVRLATHVRNARATRQAQEAVDVAGLGVVVLDGQGRVAWRSPQASRWLEEAFADQPFPLEAAGDWLAGARQPDQHG